MGCFNPHFDVYKLALIGAILVLLGDFMDLLVTYQEFCDDRCKRDNGNGAFGLERQSLERQRFRREFL